MKNNKGKGFSHSPEGNFPGGKFSSKGVGKGKMGDFFFIPAARLLEVLEHFYLREENRKWQ